MSCAVPGPSFVQEYQPLAFAAISILLCKRYSSGEPTVAPRARACKCAGRGIEAPSPANGEPSGTCFVFRAVFFSSGSVKAFRAAGTDPAIHDVFVFRVAGAGASCAFKTRCQCHGEAGAARAVKRAAASSSVPKQKKARSDHKKNVRVFGGDFSGLEVAIEAMQEVANGAACHIEVQHAFSSDVDPSCRRSFLFLGCNQTEL